MRTLSLRAMLLVVAVLPAPLRNPLLHRLARLRYRRYFPGTRGQAQNIRDRLGVAGEEAERILLRSFEIELLSILDGRRLRSLTRETAQRLVRLDGVEHLDAALARGKGVVMTTGHGPDLLAALATLGALGYGPHVIRLRASALKGRLARWAYERTNRRLERCGCTFLWMEPGSFAVGVRALNALRRNGIVLSPIDLSHSSDNTTVAFLGADAPFPRGPALLARTARAPMVDFFAHRDADERITVVFGPPYEAADVDAAVQHGAARLEAEVRRHPADWSPWHVFDEWRARG